MRVNHDEGEERKKKQILLTLLKVMGGTVMPLASKMPAYIAGVGRTGNLRGSGGPKCFEEQDYPQCAHARVTRCRCWEKLIRRYDVLLTSFLAVWNESVTTNLLHHVTSRR